MSLNEAELVSAFTEVAFSFPSGAELVSATADVAVSASPTGIEVVSATVEYATQIPAGELQLVSAGTEVAFSLPAAVGFVGFLDWTGLPTGRPVLVGFRGFLDWTGMPVGATTSAFPAQVLGLRVFDGVTVLDLCLVALADAPTGMGGVLRVQRNGIDLAAYLVETTDPMASPVRVRTSTGTKAIRLYG